MTQNRPLFLNNRLIPRPSTCTPISSKRIVSLEISIIPLGPDRNQQINKTKDKATDPSTKSPLCSASNLDTVEAIRRSYLRAQSAPPLASRADGAHTSENARINSSLLAPTQSGLDDGRKFSSPYWRARSAYHRRNADVNEAEASDLKSLEFSGAHESSQLKGTLLRPLLYTSDSGFMKHSAGCPYKCKNCFRACLVSDDFAQKAQHRRQELISKLREGDKTNANHDPISKRIYKHKEHRLDAIAIVQRALARNQPLFQRVYGGKGHPPALLPWPTYAWVDIKQKKTDKDTGASSDDVL
ncbi:hypothetical protein EGW08_001491 [Elysia chlorotica]|uniref:Uncharacterized protein n=1 Tax=Elysia chlorotica TaxID=188477 RepID=A0A3S1AFT9_ELYCH|nr:hypothetical protein EGW08_001491 [Elysia chlorotica]